MKENTITGHLASYIPEGEVDVLELIELKRYKKILKAVEDIKFDSLSELKKKVDDSFTFAELKMVLSTIEN